MSSLYVGVTRVHTLDELHVLPYNSDDAEYLLGLQWDRLLDDWLKNYSSDGRWRHDGFKKFEKEMIKREKMELALVNNLSELPVRECMAFVTKLDIASTGSKVQDL